MLFSADHGLFTWSPVLLLGVLALPFAIRRFGLLAASGLLVFALSAWFNGALSTPGAGDSFGARRFDILVPFAVLGVATLLQACVDRPLLGPTLLLAGLVAWNVGLIRLARLRLVVAAAPAEDVARLQARQARDATESLFARWLGPGGRALAYRSFVGDYFFDSGDATELIKIADPDSPYLAGGWSEALNDDGPPRFRSALYPRSCVRFPLMVAAPLTVTVTARAPARLESQSFRVSLNDHVFDAPALGPDWSDIEVRLPEDAAVPGPNRLCLEFDPATARRGGTGAAAHVRRLELRSEAPVTPTPLWGSRHPQP